MPVLMQERGLREGSKTRRFSKAQIVAQVRLQHAKSNMSKLTTIIDVQMNRIEFRAYTNTESNTHIHAYTAENS